MNSRIYRHPVSIQTRTRIILAFGVLALVLGIFQGLPGAIQSTLDLFGV